MIPRIIFEPYTNSLQDFDGHACDERPEISVSESSSISTLSDCPSPSMTSDALHEFLGEEPANQPAVRSEANDHEQAVEDTNNPDFEEIIKTASDKCAGDEAIPVEEDRLSSHTPVINEAIPEEQSQSPQVNPSHNPYRLFSAYIKNEAAGSTGSYKMKSYGVTPEYVLTNVQRDQEIQAQLSSEEPDLVDEASGETITKSNATPAQNVDDALPDTDTEVDAAANQGDGLGDDASAVPSAAQIPIAATSAIVTTSVPEVTKVFRFPELTPIDAEVKKYVADCLASGDMDELYHLAEQFQSMAQTYQYEYEALDIETQDANIYAKSEKRKANEAIKEKEEFERRQLMPAYWSVYKIYRSKLESSARVWNSFLKKEEQIKLKEEDPETYRRLVELREKPKLRKEVAKDVDGPEDEEAGMTLINKPLPKLTADDLRIEKPVKKNYLMNLERFDDRKMMDAYGLQYSAAESRVGKQDLRNRNAVDADGKLVNENGRPVRSRQKRTMYETDASGPATPEEEEVLPAKRRRIQKQQIDFSGAESGNGYSRAASPPSTFPSGKKIGRPKGSKSKPQATKSKLSEEHILTDTEEEAEAPSGTRQLAASVQSELVESVTALIAPATSNPDEGLTAAGKRKTYGSRSKKSVAEDLNAVLPVSTSEPIKSRSKATRARKQFGDASEPEEPAKSKTRGAKFKNNTDRYDDAQVGDDDDNDDDDDDDDVLPSTEQEDASRFVSASTSRPTTAQSKVTDASRRSARMATRSVSRFGGHVEHEHDAPAVSTRAKTGTKRGRDGTEGDEAAPDFNDLYDVSPQMRRKTAADFNDLYDASPQIRRKTAPKKQDLGPVDSGDDEGESGGVASNMKSKRKRDDTVSGTIEVLAPGDDYIDHGERPAKKKRAVSKKKSKSVRGAVKADVDEDEDILSLQPDFFEPIEKNGNKNMASEPAGDERDLNDDDGDDNFGGTLASGKKRPATKKRAGGKKKKQEYNLDDPTLTAEAREILRKKKQKSEKLSASAKLRWQTGQMEGPMKKRAATNKAKQAEKKAAKAAGGLVDPSVATNSLTPDAANSPGEEAAQIDTVTLQDQTTNGPNAQDDADTEPAPAEPAALLKSSRSKSAPKASSSKAPVPEPTRASTRERKAPRFPGGLDGAGDEPDDDDRAQFSMDTSVYGIYQQITSSASPGLLGKRKRRSFHPDYKALIAADDEDEDDEEYE